MITKEAIQECIMGYLESNSMFLVDITISNENDIEITIERREGSVKVDDCISIDTLVSSRFSRDKEDYSLTVSSAGLDQPFKVPAQYCKFIGEEVEVTMPKGNRIKGILSGSDSEGFEITVTRMVRKEGEKKKVPEESVTRYGFNEIKSCKPVIKFK